MALDRNALKQQLENNFRNPADNFAVPAHRFAAAYAGYAGSAMSCSGGSPVPGQTSSRQGALGAAITAAYAGSGYNYITTLTGIANGIVAFWLLPTPMIFTGPTVGTVTVVLQPTLVAALTQMVVGNQIGGGVSADTAASRWAQALDTWTRTIVVVHIPPSACTAPIS